MSNGPMRSGHDGWEGFLAVERVLLAERAEGKLERMIGRPLPGESAEELEAIAKINSWPKTGMCHSSKAIRSGTSVIDGLTREERFARLEYEKMQVGWLRGRIERAKLEAQSYESDKG